MGTMVNFRKTLLTRVLAPITIISIAAVFSKNRKIATYQSPPETASIRKNASLATTTTTKTLNAKANANASSSLLLQKWPTLTQNLTIPPPKNNRSFSELFLQPTDSIYRHYKESTAVYVVEKYKLVLFTNQKIGSTVLKMLLRRMMGYEDYDLLSWSMGIPHKFPKNGLRPLSNFSLEEADEMMTSQEWTRAMFVRDPKERALSAFLMTRPKVNITNKMIREAKKGNIDENHAKVGQLNSCCKKKAKKDYNWLLLCLNHVQKFTGFLDMIQDGKDGIGEFNSKNGAFSPLKLRKSSTCMDIHWSPITHWRMEAKCYPQLNFIGHLETAQWDVRRLLNKLHPEAWEKYGASGWGEFRNESMFQSLNVEHATHSRDHLFEYYGSKEIEKRVEKIYNDDYDNEYLQLNRVEVGKAVEYYANEFMEKWGEDAGYIEVD